LSTGTKTHQPRPLIQRRVVTYKMVPGILCARTTGSAISMIWR
jgi:hypothetical protein